MTEEDVIQITNKERRCMYCKAREVLRISLVREEVLETNLKNTMTNTYVCKDKKECDDNFKADKTQLTIGVDKETGKIVEQKVVYAGREIMSVKRK